VQPHTRCVGGDDWTAKDQISGHLRERLCPVQRTEQYECGSLPKALVTGGMQWERRRPHLRRRRQKKPSVADAVFPMSSMLGQRLGGNRDRPKTGELEQLPQRLGQIATATSCGLCVVCARDAYSRFGDALRPICLLVDFRTAFDVFGRAAVTCSSATTASDTACWLHLNQNRTASISRLLV